MKALFILPAATHSPSLLTDAIYIHGKSELSAQEGRGESKRSSGRSFKVVEEIIRECMATILLSTSSEKNKPFFLENGTCNMVFYKLTAISRYIYFYLWKQKMCHRIRMYVDIVPKITL